MIIARVFVALNNKTNLFIENNNAKQNREAAGIIIILPIEKLLYLN